MPAEILVTRDILAEDAVFILQCLRENQREGRSMHMMDVRNTLANSVTLDFADYLKFLRKHEYVVLDREQHTLSLLPAGERAAAGEQPPQLVKQLEDYFAEHLRQGVVEVTDEEEQSGRPPPPPEDLTPLPGPAPLPPERRAEPMPEVRDAFAAVLQGAPPPALDAQDELIYLRGESIGQGPIGTVFRGRHATLGTEVAIKEVRDRGPASRLLAGTELASRLKAELSAQARLDHPAIVHVHDLDLTVAQPFAVFELCAGGNLRDRLKAREGKGLEADQALRAFAQLLSGLACAHERGLVHQNLKPENVLFDAQGNAKLGDFGLSRVLAMDFGGDASRGLMVDTGGVSYLAPELLAGGGKAGTRTDVYALGIMLYEMLAGHVPGRRSPEPSRACAGVTEAVDELFDRMTADRPEERHASAIEVQTAFFQAFPDGRYGRPGEFVVAVGAPKAAAVPAPSQPDKTPPDGTAPGEEPAEARPTISHGGRAGGEKVAPPARNSQKKRG